MLPLDSITSITPHKRTSSSSVTPPQASTSSMTSLHRTAIPPPALSYDGLSVTTSPVTSEFSGPMAFNDSGIECFSSSPTDSSDLEKAQRATTASGESSDVKDFGDTEQKRTTRSQTSALGGTNHRREKPAENIIPNSTKKTTRKPRSRKTTAHERSSSISDSTDSSKASADQLRRERNRIAANRCRDKTKSLIHNLQSNEAQLASQRNQLLESLRDLQAQVYTLKQQCFDHVHCPCADIRSYLLHHTAEAGNYKSSPQMELQQSPQTDSMTKLWDDVDQTMAATDDQPWMPADAAEAMFPELIDIG